MSFAGCARLHRDQVELSPGRDCTKGSGAPQRVSESDFDARSETQVLQCMLSALRGGEGLPIRSSLLGSRICLLLATRDTDPIQREKLAAEGIRFAEKAIAGGGDNSGAAHYYLASNLGFVARDHVTLAMENLPRLERESRRALALNPNIDDGGPLRLLGMLYLKAPPWPAGIGDGDQALELLGNAVKKHPEHPLNRLFFGQALWEVDEAGDRARDELAIGMKLLHDARWGYNRAPWSLEFAAVQREFEESSP